MIIDPLDKNLESMIDRLGRERVFDYVNAHGWSPSNPPPKWVWVQACVDLNDLDKVMAR